MAKFGTYLLPEHSISSNRTTVETMAVRRRSQGSVLSGDIIVKDCLWKCSITGIDSKTSLRSDCLLKPSLY